MHPTDFDVNPHNILITDTATGKEYRLSHYWHSVEITTLKRRRLIAKIYRSHPDFPAYDAMFHVKRAQAE